MYLYYLECFVFLDLVKSLLPKRQQAYPSFVFFCFVLAIYVIGFVSTAFFIMSEYNSEDALRNLHYNLV